MLTGVGGGTGVRAPARAARAGGARRQRNRRGQAAPASPLRRRLVWTLALSVALGALFLLALSQSLVSAVNSDGSANILQAQAMLHGNPLLRGWWTSDVSFYTTELPEYALVVAARGVSPDVVHICGALTYTLTVALAALLARGSAAGLAGWRRAGLAAGIMLAPSILGGTEVFLENPDHFGTSVPVLLLFLLLDWWDRPDRRDRPLYRWYVPAAACLLLAWTQLGDELSLMAATAPIAAVCACRLIARAAAAVRRRPQAGRGAGLRTGLAEDGPLLAAAIASIGIAQLGQRAITAMGGFDLRPIPGGRLAPLGQVPGNLHLLWTSIVLLFGANNPGVPRRAITRSQHIPLVLMTDLHVIGLLLAGAGLVAGIAVGFLGWAGRPGGPARPGRPGRVGRRGKPGDVDQAAEAPEAPEAAEAPEADEADEGGARVTQILVAAIGLTMAAAVFSSVLQSVASAHEIAILVPLSAVLAGRTLPSLAARLAPASARLAPGPARLAPGAAQRAPGAGRRLASPAARAGRVATVALAAWLAVGVAEMGYGAAWPATPVPVQSVADWLTAHHQRDGLAAYWQAAQTTVASGGAIQVAPVTDSAAAAMHWNAAARWYWRGLQRATFVITEARPRQPEPALALAAVRARFGRPAGEYHVGGFIIMTYRYNLLTRVRGGGFPGLS